jgi:hypothetical protein
MVTWHHAGYSSGGRAAASAMPAMAVAAGHLPAMAQAAGGPFRQTFLEVVLFDNTLGQVV